jgi:hypothetical protein
MEPIVPSAPVHSLNEAAMRRKVDDKKGDRFIFDKKGDRFIFGRK